MLGSKILAIWTLVCLLTINRHVVGNLGFRNLVFERLLPI